MPFSALIVTAMYPHAERPGNGAFVMHQAEALRAMGHRVDVIHVKGYQSRLNYLKGMFTVLRATRLGSYDVVHVHYGLTGICTLFRWRTPLVVTLHGSDVLQGWFQRLVSRLVSALADATIVVSPEVARCCPGTLIPCGVDLGRFRPLDRAEARRSLGLVQGDRYVLFPFDPDRGEKRWDLATAAVARLRELGMAATLLPVWNVPNDQMPLYYAAADVMILCSDTEGSPTSVKEALACNLPVVSTDVGDVRAIMREVCIGQICDRSVPALADALGRTLSRTDPVEFDGQSAMARYDNKATVEGVVRVYESVLQSPRQRDVHA